ncbi:MAG: NAD-dependent deacylase [Armatimonadota bacterium]|nr:NAD-dependent deacylase [Armatimonadota bacterium]MDR7421337.1 NAD-dependent deacylase [Armatimonadota bacterium]MDR7455233.1 NAD-dependent deacylase [Armatimonadota bacterium]MDR7456513.1 NAD-dependent deacylase [Armatimonadota bacterium]MDR7496220.1 NAD-dependent deacylase [Armatimonadota bacterium]
MSVEDALRRLRAARRAVALTGAGVSTASGLPDFRSVGGLWVGVDPMTVASRTALERDPAAFYAFYRGRLARLDGASPNPAHRALVALERAGRLRAVLTQNVDGLHQAAGSAHVVELHGNLREAACIACGGIAPIAALIAPLDAGRLPRCERCGGLLKPNVVLFEDPMPADAWRRAVLEARAADVMLVVGSSLQVTPAAYLPRETLDRGGALVIVNREPTPYDRDAAVVIHGEADRILPAISRGLDGREEAPSGATN